MLVTLLFLVESLIQLMSWVTAEILNWFFKPLNIKILQYICTHVCTLKCIVYFLSFCFCLMFYMGVFYKIKKADLALLLPLCTVLYVIKTIVFSIMSFFNCSVCWFLNIKMYAQSG